jgi:hypothetical protein
VRFGAKIGVFRRISGVRLVTGRHRRVPPLQQILHKRCRFLLHVADRSREVGIEHLQVVPVGDPQLLPGQSQSQLDALAEQFTKTNSKARSAAGLKPSLTDGLTGRTVAAVSDRRTLVPGT